MPPTPLPHRPRTNDPSLRHARHRYGSSARQTTYEKLMARFETRLKEIANQDNDTIMNTTRWGDKPYRWDRL